MTTALHRGRKRLLAVTALILVLGAFGYLLYGGIGENLVYFLSPKELLAKGTAAYDVPVRLGGQVVPGSVQWNPDRLELRFRVTDGAEQVNVRSTGAPPMRPSEDVASASSCAGSSPEGRSDQGPRSP